MAEQDHELVAAHARDRVRLPDAALQFGGDTLEEHVAGQMADAVIDKFEAIQIEDHHSKESIGVSPGPMDRVVQPGHEQRTVGESGEPVGEGLMA